MEAEPSSQRAEAGHLGLFTRVADGKITPSADDAPVVSRREPEPWTEDSLVRSAVMTLVMNQSRGEQGLSGMVQNLEEIRAGSPIL